MAGVDLDFTISRLGSCRIPSPMSPLQYVDDEAHILYHSELKPIKELLEAGKTPPCYEIAGPREKIFFDPSKLKCGIVTCGGLCPGQNDVIRSIVLSLHHHYGVRTVFGFRYGFEGLTYRHGHTPLELTPDSIREIYQQGGTILGSSRGPQDPVEMVDTLETMNISVLFTIGGDGTLRGAQALAGEIAKRGLKIAVIGIPKTIDNDISFIEQSFGFSTAVSEAELAIFAANTEALGARNGIGLVKLMGRESGFISAHATLATGEVNFCLVPEVPFSLEGFLTALKARIEARGHAVIVVAEGAGQDLMAASGGRDASGNVQFSDIGVFLKDRIKEYFAKTGHEINLKYIDPSYMIRTKQTNTLDSIFCLLLGHNAVHAAMTGRTDMVVGYWKNEFTHVPIPMAVSKRKRIDPVGRLWNDVLASTGQPRGMF